MPGASGAKRYRVRFDSAAWQEDLNAASPAARQVAETARARIERDGLAEDVLLGCSNEGPDGTQLGGCVKTYLPLGKTVPEQPHGMVFAGAAEDASLLAFIAFGVRHPPRNSSKWSVYQRAHNRLHR